MCRQALEAELKLVKGDLHRVTQELQERRQRVEKLEAKFAVVSTKKKSVYDEEEPKSQAYYVIKAAQQRQELQASGDRLDAENHRLQKEVCIPVTNALQELEGPGCKHCTQHTVWFKMFAASVCDPQWHSKRHHAWQRTLISAGAPEFARHRWMDTMVTVYHIHKKTKYR